VKVSYDVVKGCGGSGFPISCTCGVCHVSDGVEITHDQHVKNFKLMLKLLNLLFEFQKDKVSLPVSIVGSAI
jgi:hypothetical protein